MPKEIIRQYRVVYEKHFMLQTLLAIPKALLKTAAFDGEIGFPNSFILVDFAGKPHPKINAVNFIKQVGSEKHGHIYVNSDLHMGSKEMLKVALAEEWIEVMMGFRDPTSVHKSITGKIPLALLFNSLKRRGFWQDTKEEYLALHSALRTLLVSKSDLEELAMELHDKTLEKLKKFVDVSPQEAQARIEELVLAFSAKHYVDKELVYDRLMELMIDGHTP
jgi:hypothetical protein